MSGYIGLAVALVGAIAQATALRDVGWNGVHPDLVVLAALAWSAIRRFEDGLLWALLGGVALDLNSAGPFGASVAALALAAAAAGLLAQRLRRGHPVLTVLTLPLGVLLFYLLSVAFHAVGGQPVDLAGLATGVLLPALAIDTAVGLPLLLILAWLSRIITPPSYPTPGRTSA